jgi:hypothetical protein
VRRVFDWEKKDFRGDEREIAIKKLIINYTIPFLNDIGTKEGIKQAVHKYKGLRIV